jgi:hypothetical protein
LKTFHHVALLSERERPGETFSELLKVWVVSPDDDPHRVEWVRIASDSPLRDTPLARMPHVAWQVDDLDAELQGKEVVFGPIGVGGGLRVGFFLMNGALIEYMESKPQ